MFNKTLTLPPRSWRQHTWPHLCLRNNTANLWPHFSYCCLRNNTAKLQPHFPCLSLRNNTVNLRPWILEVTLYTYGPISPVCLSKTNLQISSPFPPILVLLKHNTANLWPWILEVTLQTSGPIFPTWISETTPNTFDHISPA